MKVFLEDTIGQRFDLADCSLYCHWAGEMDYGDPAIVVLPDGQTLGFLCDFSFFDEDGESVDPDMIDWSAL